MPRVRRGTTAPLVREPVKSRHLLALPTAFGNQETKKEQVGHGSPQSTKMGCLALPALVAMASAADSALPQAMAGEREANASQPRLKIKHGNSLETEPAASPLEDERPGVTAPHQSPSFWQRRGARSLKLARVARGTETKAVMAQPWRVSQSLTFC
jgi:hypothetical protein